MKQESDASKQPGQQPTGYEQQNPEQRNQPYRLRQRDKHPLLLTESARKSRSLSRSLVKSCLPHLTSVKMFATVHPSGVMILAKIYAKSPGRISLGGNILAKTF